ncbi:hypothetical protein [Pararhizobium arenae]|uniref:hypothetical protein n=1 Tax=Pararhizobium arenae TaxID=1856850 RepID=UPI00094AF59B|nr:hypothetical protein [Pararhizobium arenae]
MPRSEAELSFSSPKELIEIYRRLANDLEQVGRDGPESIAPEVSISDWIIAKRAVPILLGTVLGHPTVRDGKPAASTEIVYWDEHWQLARTLNRWYRLGRPLIGGSNQ